MTPFAAASRSTPSSTMIESLPPISATTLLSQICPGWTFAADSLMWIPTSLEPVNETKRVFGWSTSVSPTAAPGPETKFTTPGGSPTSRRISMNFQPIHGESLEGFSTTVFPVTSAAEVIPARIARGKFHGGMITPTPSGM